MWRCLPNSHTAMLVVIGVRHGFPCSTFTQFLHNVCTYVHTYIHAYLPIHNVLAEAVCYFPRNTFTELSL